MAVCFKMGMIKAMVPVGSFEKVYYEGDVKM